MGRLTMRRPEALNALNEQTLREVLEVATLAATQDLDVFVITGEGRAFVAGADIKAMVNYSAEQAAAFGKLGNDAFGAIAALPCPTIAAVNGFALGGGLELALSCDLIYASDKARVGLPEVSLSVIPGWGGTQRLGRIAGWHVARELIYTGRQVKADEAKALGIVLDVFPLDEFHARIDAIVQSIQKNGPLALRAAKRALAVGYEANLAQGMSVETQGFAGLFGTADQREGMTAFIEGRPATFTRR
ncbi:MAG: enoyl-CoA hydratase-related protein [bacterium]